MNHVKSALKRCGYKDWSFKRACVKKDRTTDAAQDPQKSRSKSTPVVIPFVKGVSERLKRVYSKYGASTAFKPHQTIRRMLVAPKDKATTEEKSGVVYRFPCKDCDKVYVGETKRSLGDRVKEHIAKTPSNQSALAEHRAATGHELDSTNVKVLCREDKLIPRKIREAIHIKKETSPTLNRDGGREISKVYDSLLDIPKRNRRTPPTSTNRGSVSHPSASNR